jgi:hypothetical protein
VPTGGQQKRPLVAMKTAHSWPRDLPTGWSVALAMLGNGGEDQCLRPRGLGERDLDLPDFDGATGCTDALQEQEHDGENGEGEDSKQHPPGFDSVEMQHLAETAPSRPKV